MDIVVKLPDKDYSVILTKIMLACRGCKIIELPKGHGRLKDTDAICKDIISALGIRDENYLLEAEKAIYKRIKNASTIIEADRSEEE